MRPRGFADNAKCGRVPGHAIVATEFTREALSSGSGLFEYGTEAFTKLACARPVYLQTILDLGFSVVWSDTDTVWLQDFLKLTPNVRMPPSQPHMHMAATTQEGTAWAAPCSICCCIDTANYATYPIHYECTSGIAQLFATTASSHQEALRVALGTC